MARVLAGDDRSHAVQRALALRAHEHSWHVDIEHELNRFVTSSEILEVASAYWYSAAHYLVTPTVLFWLWRRRPGVYRPMRSTLGIATASALLCYLTLPLAPPRYLPTYVDTLDRTSWAGWWAGDASAPRGLGEATNQLAAMPSMHVGWAVWVAIAIVTNTPSRWRHLAWLYPMTTAIVVLGTANHWTADAIVGAALVVVAWRVVSWQPKSAPVSLASLTSDPEASHRHAFSTVPPLPNQTRTARARGSLYRARRDPPPSRSPRRGVSGDPRRPDDKPAAHGVDRQVDTADQHG
ncbi:MULTISPECIES: phosphatase PAP2 family protein [unclassified Nocardioides]|uniref:phosphatase PAP2 family protein n=1 Tax=unclassified Nocardioides TaxID=2615069 RepID=UPI000A26B1A6